MKKGDQVFTEKERNKLYNYAKKASKSAYSPYSRFPVGAAVLTKSKKVFLGSNVENASYGLTICAERVAMCNAISNGHKDIIAIAIFSKKGEATPCGACRQFISEFGKKIQVIYKRNTRLITRPVSDLIPEYFSKKELK